MKIFFVLFLLLTVTSSAFAEFYWSLHSQFSTHLINTRLPLGERAEQLITVDGQLRYNTIVGHNPSSVPILSPFNITRGDFSYFGRATSAFAGVTGNALRFGFGWFNDHVMFHTAVYLDQLVRTGPSNEGTGQHDFFAGPNDQSFIVGDGRTPNWSAIFRYAWQEWFFMTLRSPFTIFVGITDNHGRVDNFNNQDSLLLGGILVENFGILAPNFAADFIHQGLDINNMARSGARHQLFTSIRSTLLPYFMLSYRLENTFAFPLTFQIAVDPGNNSGIGAHENFRRVHGAFRVSGENIFERINFDAIYRIAGGDSITMDDFDRDMHFYGNLLPSGDGFVVHEWGLFANVMNVFGFNFGMGISGHLVSLEDYLRKEDELLIARTSPLFTGIDFRVQYTGIRNLTITLFNNVSFAQTETVAPDRWVMGVTGVQIPNGSQEWFGMYNTITVVYRLTDQLTFSVQGGHRHGLITTRDVITPGSGGVLFGDIERGMRRFGGGAFVNLRYSTVNLQAGISIRHFTEFYYNTVPIPPGSALHSIAGYRDARGGILDIAIPLTITIDF